MRTVATSTSVVAASVAVAKIVGDGPGETVLELKVDVGAWLNAREEPVNRERSRPPLEAEESQLVWPGPETALHEPAHLDWPARNVAGCTEHFDVDVPVHTGKLLALVRLVSPSTEPTHPRSELGSASPERHTLLVNRAQRHVAVVAIGLTCAISAQTINRLLDRGDVDGGWFMYAPNSDPPFTPSFDGPIWRTSLVWLAAVLVWTLAAWRLYRDPKTK